MQELWQEAKKSLQGTIPPGSFHIWVEPIVFNAKEENSIVLACPNRFSLSWVKDNYLTLIREEIEQLYGKQIAIKLIACNKTEGDEPSRDEQLPLPCLEKGVSHGRPLCSRFTFEEFVTGNSNSFAFSMAQAIAQGTNMYNNFLYFLSDTGLGKSHLAQAIAHDMLRGNKASQLIYLTAEEFTNDMVKSIRNNNVDQFKERYRKNCDVFMLDEVHFLEGKERTQAELSLLIDWMFESNKKVIFTSSQLPKDIPRLNTALRSRLNGGLIASILPPDYETRVKIIQKKAKNQNVALSDDVVDYLATTIKNDIRQLESSVIGLAAQSSLLHQPITLELAKEVTNYLVTNKREVCIDTIQKLIGQYYRISLDELKSKSRKQAVSHPRHVAIYLSRTFTKGSLENIGKAFNRNHATVLHAVNFVRRELDKRSQMGKQVEYLSEKLKTGTF